jgi:hypothetical protein
MSEFNNLKKFKIRNYENKDLNNLVRIFIKFQIKNDLDYYSNIKKNSSEAFYIPYLAEEIKKLTRTCEIILEDSDLNKVIAAAFFKKIEEGNIQLMLAFKDESYIYNAKFKQALEKTFNEVKINNPKCSIIATLGNRKKYKKYINFLKRIFKIKVISELQFNKILVLFK